MNMDGKAGKGNVWLRRYGRAVAVVAITGFLVVGLSAYVHGQDQAQAPPPPQAAAAQNQQNRGAALDQEIAKETVLKITAPFTIATVGDILEPRPVVLQDPAFQKLVDVIRKSDVGFANMEASLVDPVHFTGPLGGMLAPLETGAAIKAMGINVVNRANNHALDGGLAGMISTDEALDKLGIVHAGTGKDLNQARASQFLETPKGRVGIVGMFALDDVSPAYGPIFGQTLATYRNGDLDGAPGVDGLHLTDYHIVTADQLQTLKSMRDAVFGQGGGRGAGPGGPRGGAAAGGATPERVKFFDDWFQAGDAPGTISYGMNVSDERDILKSIRNGKIESEFMIATIHSHHTVNYEALGAGGDDHGTPDFLIKLAHDCIDNGADIFISHGLHDLRGVEIYKGKPIFYSLSNFFFQRDLQYGMLDSLLNGGRGLTSLYSASTQETILATSHFENGKLVEVRLYPVDLGGSDRPVSLMGTPMTPSPEAAKRILAEMQELSKPYGTTITIDNNVGVIRVAPSAAKAPGASQQ